MLEDNLVECAVYLHEKPDHTDHFPIHTRLELSYEQAPTTVARNYKKVDWEEFERVLKDKLVDVPTQAINDREEFQVRLSTLTKAILDTIAEVVPMSVARPSTKRWWSEHLSELFRFRNNLYNRSRRHADEPRNPIHEEYHKASREFRQAVEQARTDCWNRYIDNVDGDALWRAHKYLKSLGTDTGSSRIPTLTTKQPDGSTMQSVTNADKSRTLYESFFPRPVAAPIPEHDYPEAATEFRIIDEKDVQNAISNLKPGKAPARTASRMKSFQIAQPLSRRTLSRSTRPLSPFDITQMNGSKQQQ
ncbi:reverse transcriptase, putative, partial [Rhizoctonia solani AG-3 Rhs1AP]